jgi:hypothetical protein
LRRPSELYSLTIVRNSDDSVDVSIIENSAPAISMPWSPGGAVVASLSTTVVRHPAVL